MLNDSSTMESVRNRSDFVVDGIAVLIFAVTLASRRRRRPFPMLACPPATSGHELQRLSRGAVKRWLGGMLLFLLIVPARHALFASRTLLALDLVLVW